MQVLYIQRAETEPPPNFKRITPFLAITERGDIPLLYDKRKKMLPPSAGLVVRKQAWQDIPENPILTGRANGNMLILLNTGAELSQN